MSLWWFSYCSLEIESILQQISIILNLESIIYERTRDDSVFSSHLLGMFYRTIRMIDNGIKPVYVFDGKPPKMKAGELEKRSERRTEAEKQRKDAVELGDEESINKFDRRLVKVISSLF